MSSSMEDELAVIFDEFCSFGAGHRRAGPPLMDSRTCVKLARDCGLLDKNHLNRTDVDLVFAKVKPKGEKKINFPEFLEVTKLWANKKRTTQEELLQAIINSRGPQFNGATLTQYTKFHDDKTMYTGVHAKGGPTTNDHKITLSNLADRSPSDIRGRKIDNSPQDREGGEDYFIATNAAQLYELSNSKTRTPPRTPPSAMSGAGLDSTTGKTKRKTFLPGDLHPDYYEVLNPNHTGPGDKYYYVNRITNVATWDKITVPPPPQPKFTSTPPPPPPLKVVSAPNNSLVQ